MLRFKKLLVLTFLVALVLLVTVVPRFQVSALDTWTWKNVNLQGMGFVTGLTIHPTNTNLMYVRTDVGGAYRWNAAGSKWICITDKLKVGGVEAIALDPNNTNLVYLVSADSGGTKLYKSTDQGANWTVMSGFPNLYINANGQYRWVGKKLIVDPNGGGNVLYFASRRNGLYKSTNAGANWTQISTSSVPTGSDEANYYWGQTFVAVDKNSGNSGASQTVYVGVQKYGVYRSQNSGSSWSLLSGGPATTYKPVAGVVGSDGALYVTYSNGNNQDNGGTGYIYKFVNGAGSNVTPATNGGTGFTGIDVNGSYVVAMQWNTDPMITYSTNGGGAWTTKSFTTRTEPAWYPSWANWTWTAHIMFNPANANQVWLTTGFGVYKTDIITAATPAWTAQMNQLEELCGGKICIPPVTGGVDAFCMNMDKIGFRVVNRDTVPSGTINPGNFGIGTGIDFCVASPSIIAYVGSQQNTSSCYAKRSTDNGANWSDMTIPTDFTNGNIAISATDGNRMVWAPLNYYWGDNTKPNKQPAYTTNGGTSWTTCGGIPVKRSDATEMYAMSTFLASDRVNGSIFYYYLYDSSSSTLYKSTDGGVNFTSVNTSLPGNYQCQLKAVPGKEGHLFYHANGGSLYKSANYGSNFTAVTGISNVKAIGFGKINTYGPVIYLVGTINSREALYRSADYGATWSEATSNDAGVPVHQASNVSGDLRDENIVYLSTGGRGFFYGVLTVSGNPTPMPTATASASVIVTPTPTATPTTSSGGGSGLKGEYYDNMDLTNLKVTRTDATVNFDWGTGSPDASIGADTFSVRWTGQVLPKFSQTYTFYTQSDDGVRLWVNSQQLVNNWTNHSSTENSGTIALTAGVKYDIKMEYYENTGGAVAKLSWSSSSQVKEIIPQSQLYPAGAAIPTATASATAMTTATATPTATPAASTTNLLQDPGFESGGFAYWADDWGNSAIDSANVHSGTKAVRIGTYAGGRAQTLYSGFTAGASYTLSGWGKAGTEYGYIGVKCYNSSWGLLSDDSIEYNTSTYTQKSRTVTLPAGTANLQVYAWKNDGSGYFYADDISFIKQ